MVLSDFGDIFRVTRGAESDRHELVAMVSV